MTNWTDKIPEFLKTPAELALTISLASGLLLFLTHIGWVPAIKDTLWEALAWVALLGSGAIALAAPLRWLQKAWYLGWDKCCQHSKTKAYRRHVAREMPLLSKKERLILGYLREKKLNMFTSETSGGHAVTLVSREFVQMEIGANQQIINTRQCPFRLNPIVWEYINDNPDEFPHEPIMQHGVEVAPWIIHRAF